MTKPRPLAIFAALLALAAITFGLRLSLLRYTHTAYPMGYGEAVAQNAAEEGPSPALLFAVIRCESGFDSNAVSHVQARGLMQITNDAFEWARMRQQGDASLTFNDMFTPETNIEYGAAILRLLLDEFGSERVALAAYHAGRGEVMGWLRNTAYSSDGKSLDYIPFDQTRAYVDKVLETKLVYQRLYGIA